MLTVLVSIKVKPDQLKAFTDATISEVQASSQDQGVVGIDILQESDDHAHFTLHEVFQSRQVGMQHLEMAHFKQWQSIVKPMLIEPPHAAAFEHVFPIK